MSQPMPPYAAAVPVAASASAAPALDSPPVVSAFQQRRPQSFKSPPSRQNVAAEQPPPPPPAPIGHVDLVRQSDADSTSSCSCSNESLAANCISEPALVYSSGARVSPPCTDPNCVAAAAAASPQPDRTPMSQHQQQRHGHRNQHHRQQQHYNPQRYFHQHRHAQARQHGQRQSWAAFTIATPHHNRRHHHNQHVLYPPASVVAPHHAADQPAHFGDFSAAAQFAPPSDSSAHHRQLVSRASLPLGRPQAVTLPGHAYPEVADSVPTEINNRTAAAQSDPPASLHYPVHRYSASSPPPNHPQAQRLQSHPNGIPGSQQPQQQYDHTKTPPDNFRRSATTRESGSSRWNRQQQNKVMTGNEHQQHGTRQAQKTSFHSQSLDSQQQLANEATDKMQLGGPDTTAGGTITTTQGGSDEPSNKSPSKRNSRRPRPLDQMSNDKTAPTSVYSGTGQPATGQPNNLVANSYVPPISATPNIGDPISHQPATATAAVHIHQSPHHSHQHLLAGANLFETPTFCPLPPITSHRRHANSPWMRISSIILTPIGIVIVLFIVVSPLLHYLM